jgi:hypothetical protein
MISLASLATFHYAERIRQSSQRVAHDQPPVPNVVGLGREEAIDVLSRDGFATVAISKPSKSVRPGIVLRQSSRSRGSGAERIERLLFSSMRRTPCTRRQPKTRLRLTTRLHSPELIPRCVVAAAGQRLTLVFRDNLVGAPANLSIYPTTSSTFAIVNGRFLARPRDRAHALFIGHRSWLPKRITYHVGALKPGTYVLQGDSYPSLMHADLIVSRAK